VKQNRTQFVKRFQLIFIFLLIIAFTGCLPSYHYGYLGTEHAALLNSRDTGLTNYTGISVSTGGASNKDEKSTTLKLRHQFNYTYNWCSFSAHADAYTGYHTVEAVEEYAGESYNYYGIAPQISASLFYPFKAGRWGIYGSFGTFWEFGSYPDWIEKVDNDNLLTLEDDEFMGKVCFGGVGILHEVIYSEDKMISFQIGTGKPGIIHSFTSFHNRKYVISVGVSAIFEGSGSVFINYMRKW